MNPLDYFPTFEEWASLKQQVDALPPLRVKVKSVDSPQQVPDAGPRQQLASSHLGGNLNWYYYAAPDFYRKQLEQQEAYIREQTQRDQERRIQEMQRLLGGDPNGLLGGQQRPEP